MVSVFEYDDYRLLLRDWVAAQPKSHGVKSRLAAALGVSSSLISLILSGDKQLSLEQATEAVEYMSLNDDQSEFFLLLVELDRAGTQKLKIRIQKKIESARRRAQKISSRVPKPKELTPEANSIFYSNWIYTAILNLIALEDCRDIQSLALRLTLPEVVVSKAVSFLTEHHLCYSDKGQLSYGAAHSHLPDNSPHVNKHHQNWRIQAMTRMDHLSEQNLFYSCPMSLSEDAYLIVRKRLLRTIEKTLKEIGPSPSECVACLNIDFFRF